MLSPRELAERAALCRENAHVLAAFGQFAGDPRNLALSLVGRGPELGEAAELGALALRALAAVLESNGQSTPEVARSALATQAELARRLIRGHEGRAGA